MFQRLINLFRGFLGLFISGMERTNPEALLEVEKENLREQISKYNDGLASHAALCERLMSRPAVRERERDLRARPAPTCGPATARPASTRCACRPCSATSGRTANS
jgi:hypothetical protein